VTINEKFSCEYVGLLRNARRHKAMTTPVSPPAR